jgi:hypothetical protein
VAAVAVAAGGVRAIAEMAVAHARPAARAAALFALSLPRSGASATPTIVVRDTREAVIRAVMNAGGGAVDELLLPAHGGRTTVVWSAGLTLIVPATQLLVELRKRFPPPPQQQPQQSGYSEVCARNKFQ